ncbi:choice-of-anchor B family protein [Rhodocaloribacter litoris]|uniref:choice-of-anchor B family protein n=1 Tax=Rhodocaloribacter litoris TaxID=2558931 RepID=UPI001E5B70F3|nr:choice-of-anchor B family protein [Rhodocaloribacter litoris]QXD14610.1 choice-of-anchor B family protein [Rhodocaloribacter litoris]
MRRLVPLVLVCLLTVPSLAQQFGGTLALGDGEVFAGETRNEAWPGRVYVFRPDAGGAWEEAAVLQPSDAGDAADGFGRALALDASGGGRGARLLVGANLRDGQTGAAYVFERSRDGHWVETARLGAGAPGGRFGTSVALAGDVALVAATEEDSTGVVHVFERDAAGRWTRTARLAPAGLEADARFGTGLAFDGTVALAGAPGHDGGAGAVYAFRRAEDGTWTETGRLEAGTLEAGSSFGVRIVLAGARAFVAAPGFGGGLGTVFAFTWDAGAGTWRLSGRVVPFDADPGRFGTALAYDGQALWVGAPRAGGFRGAVYRFIHGADGTGWAGVEKVQEGGLLRGAAYGAALAAQGGRALIGVTGADYGAGAVQVLERVDGTWTARARLVHRLRNFEAVTGGRVTCEEGRAAAFDCQHVDLLSFLPVQDIGGGRGVRTNDLWGWTDPETGREYALVGLTDATSFIDVTDPYRPVLLGTLPLHEGANGSVWRDIKVYRNHAFIVADGAGPHGMQVFDLTRLRRVENPPVTFTEDAHYDRINSAHNIVINEETGFGFIVGASMGGETCGGGLHMIDLREPKNPQFAGCFSHTGTGRQGTGYTHDAQCVVYRGPDAEHRGKEICFGANETALSIADVTDKANPKAIARATYPRVAYTHQGWLTEDQHYFYVNDEGDEAQGLVAGTRTLIWDVSDLDDPQLVGEYIATNRAIDHNLYIRGNLMYQSNYVAGLRILDITNPERPVEVGYFDTVPYGEDAPTTGGGSWSNYPFFKSGIIVVTSGREGVFILKRSDVDL